MRITTHSASLWLIVLFHCMSSVDYWGFAPDTVQPYNSQATSKGSLKEETEHVFENILKQKHSSNCSLLQTLYSSEGTRPVLIILLLLSEELLIRKYSSLLCSSYQKVFYRRFSTHHHTLQNLLLYRKHSSCFTNSFTNCSPKRCSFSLLILLHKTIIRMFSNYSSKCLTQQDTHPVPHLAPQNDTSSRSQYCTQNDHQTALQQDNKLVLLFAPQNAPQNAYPKRPRNDTQKALEKTPKHDTSFRHAKIPIIHRFFSKQSKTG